MITVTAETRQQQKRKRPLLEKFQNLDSVPIDDLIYNNKRKIDYTG